MSPVDLEILVSDNASTDDSVAVVKALGDPRIHVEVQPWNVGFAGNDREVRDLDGHAACFHQLAEHRQGLGDFDAGGRYLHDVVSGLITLESAGVVVGRAQAVAVVHQAARGLFFRVGGCRPGWAGHADAGAQDQSAEDLQLKSRGTSPLALRVKLVGAGEVQKLGHC